MILYSSERNRYNSTLIRHRFARSSHILGGVLLKILKISLDLRRWHHSINRHTPLTLKCSAVFKRTAIRRTSRQLQLKYYVVCFTFANHRNSRHHFTPRRSLLSIFIFPLILEADTTFLRLSELCQESLQVSHSHFVFRKGRHLRRRDKGSTFSSSPSPLSLSLTHYFSFTPY